LPRARREEADRLRATKAQVRRFYQDVMSKSLAQRRQMTGIGPRRAEIIVPGAALYWRVLEIFQHHSMYYLAAGVREGIIADLAARGVGRELSQLSREQRSVVEKLSRKYAIPIKHSRKVAALGHQIYTAMHPQHRLPPAYGKILEAAAYLHDAGHFISDTSHHKHSEYIVRNADLAGFTDHERILIALLCRYHRKAMPQLRHAEFQALAPEERKALLLLIPLLRLADSLDRTNQQLVESVAMEMRAGALVASIHSHGDSDLDEWAAERLTDIFNQVYNKPLEVIRTKAS
jgi:exopolyphosphatase/guanosine-5'-triphosphate,3'-diphosphate pyrophosphatase